MSNNLVNRVIKCVSEQAQLPIKDIDLSDSLILDIGFDSIDLVELGFLLEQEFGLADIGNEYTKYKTVGGVAEYIEKLKNR